MRSRGSRYLVAPDSFKGSFGAAQVAEAIAAGLRDGGAASIDICPVADGGEGTAGALVAALGGRHLARRAHDPLGRPIEARFALLGDGRTAAVDTASASGLALIPPSERDPERASTAGTGELVAAAIDAGAERILVAAGGSAATDGGSGAIEAIEAAGGLRGARLEVLCDVETPFERAAAVFGPQKGADAAAVERLTARLVARAAALPRDPTGIPMTGCAGGLSGGLWARFDARLRPGAAFVFGLLDVPARVRACDVAVSGEGRLDWQSFQGKAAGTLARLCRESETRLELIVGETRIDPASAAALGIASVRVAGTLAAIREAARAAAAG